MHHHVACSVYVVVGKMRVGAFKAEHSKQIFQFVFH